MAYDDFLGRIPNRPSPASESGVLRVEGAAATPSRSPKGYERGHGMGKGWGSVGSAYEMGGGHAEGGWEGRGVSMQGVWGSQKGFGEVCAGCAREWVRWVGGGLVVPVPQLGWRVGVVGGG